MLRKRIWSIILMMLLLATVLNGCSGSVSVDKVIDETVQLDNSSTTDNDKEENTEIRTEEESVLEESQPEETTNIGESDKLTEKQTETSTIEPTEEQTEALTANPTEAVTEAPTQKITEAPTESPTQPTLPQYEYEVLEGNTICITRYIGEDTDVVIPSKIEDMPVTTIGEWAFSGCHNIKSIKIPNSVTSIKYMTFSGCASLISIEFSNEVTNIGIMAFYRCVSLTSIDIPESITNIGFSAFEECSNLLIKLKKDSYAEQYAKDNSLSYIYY